MRVGPGAKHRQTWPAWSSRAHDGDTPAVPQGNQNSDEEGLTCAEAGRLGKDHFGSHTSAWRSEQVGRAGGSHECVHEEGALSPGGGAAARG